MASIQDGLKQDLDRHQGDGLRTIHESLKALESVGDPIRLLVEVEAVRDLIANYRERSEGAASTDEAVQPSFESLRSQYEQSWTKCAPAAAHAGDIAWYLGRLRAGKPRYGAVATAVQAPWWFIAVVHALEASFSFTTHLHNGDPLTARTVHVPAGRPQVWLPPSDWEASAADAITFQGYAHQADWSVARALYRFEGYNGYGYYAKNINSPYLWSFSNLYTKGKFVEDHKYDPNAVSKQCGAAVMLKALVTAGDVVP